MEVRYCDQTFPLVLLCNCSLVTAEPQTDLEPEVDLFKGELWIPSRI